MMWLNDFYKWQVMIEYGPIEYELWINNNNNNNNNSQLHWYWQGYVDISSYLFSVFWGGGVGRGTHRVGVLLLCSGIQAGTLYAMIPASNVGRRVDDGQWLWHGPSRWHGLWWAHALLQLTWGSFLWLGLSCALWLAAWGAYQSGLCTPWDTRSRGCGRLHQISARLEWSPSHVLRPCVGCELAWIGPSTEWG